MTQFTYHYKGMLSPQTIDQLAYMAREYGYVVEVRSMPDHRLLKEVLKTAPREVEEEGCMGQRTARTTTEPDYGMVRRDPHGDNKAAFLFLKTQSAYISFVREFHDRIEDVAPFTTSFGGST